MYQLYLAITWITKKKCKTEIHSKITKEKKRQLLFITVTILVGQEFACELMVSRMNNIIILDF
jgi:uncharacterized membrane protein YwzB